MPRHNKQIKHKKIAISDNSCAAKRQYSTNNEARQTAKYQMAIDPDIQLTTYQCGTCSKWHLTRSNRQ